MITPCSSKIYVTFELIDYSNFPEYFNMKCDFTAEGSYKSNNLNSVRVVKARMAKTNARFTICLGTTLFWTFLLRNVGWDGPTIGLQHVSTIRIPQFL